MTLDQPLALAFAELAVGNIQTEFPHKLDHVFESAADVKTPRQLHPVFYGSYDWHSSVHMHWLLVRLIRLHPGIDSMVGVSALLTKQFSHEKIGAECKYLKRASSRGFERTYGWAWLLALQGELLELAAFSPPARAWADALAPLAEAFVARYLEFLPVADFAVRSGTHQNSAFGLLLAHIAAAQMNHTGLLEAVTAKARSWFLQDQDVPARLEPSGSDFLSAGLIEAALMQRVLGSEFSAWWSQFEPKQDDALVWLKAVAVSDRSDAQLSHLDGLNLSRAWCMRRLASSLPTSQAALYMNAASRMIEAALPHAHTGYFVGTHWLA